MPASRACCARAAHGRLAEVGAGPPCPFHTARPAARRPTTGRRRDGSPSARAAVHSPRTDPWRVGSGSRPTARASRSGRASGDAAGSARWKSLGRGKDPSLGCRRVGRQAEAAGHASDGPGRCVVAARASMMGLGLERRRWTARPSATPGRTCLSACRPLPIRWASARACWRPCSGSSKRTSWRHCACTGTIPSRRRWAQNRPPRDACGSTCAMIAPSAAPISRPPCFTSRATAGASAPRRTSPVGPRYSRPTPTGVTATLCRRTRAGLDHRGRVLGPHAEKVLRTGRHGGRGGQRVRRRLR